VGKRVLVVEDNELNLKLFSDLLRVHGHTPEPVRDGREAHARAQAFGPDLIIMDIQLPHVSGLDLIILLKGDAELRRIPIMAVTAFAAKGDEERIRAAGAEAYVSKPISVMRFILSVNALLEAEPEAEGDAPPPESEERHERPINESLEDTSAEEEPAEEHGDDHPGASQDEDS
jgi:two-component system, cell cycle response regulator DivK